MVCGHRRGRTGTRPRAGSECNANTYAKEHADNSRNRGAR
jgi:hypothetical protein